MEAYKSIKVSIINKLSVHQCCDCGEKHWSRSVCAGALCCSNTVLALAGFDEIGIWQNKFRRSVFPLA